MTKFKFGFVYKSIDNKTKKILIKQRFYNKKYNITQNKNIFILAHDHNNISTKGDFVCIQFSRKFSKNKNFFITKII